SSTTVVVVVEVIVVDVVELVDGAVDEDTATVEVVGGSSVSVHAASSATTRTSAPAIRTVRRPSTCPLPRIGPGQEGDESRAGSDVGLVGGAVGAARSVATAGAARSWRVHVEAVGRHRDRSHGVAVDER